MKIEIRRQVAWGVWRPFILPYLNSTSLFLVLQIANTLVYLFVHYKTYVLFEEEIYAENYMYKITVKSKQEKPH